MTLSSSKPKGIIKYSYTENGVKFYEARIETMCYDHSPRNPSLPVAISNEDYCLTYEQAVNYIRSFGFDGQIETIEK